MLLMLHGSVQRVDADSSCSFQRDFTRCTEKSLRGYSRGSWRTTFYHLQQPYYGFETKADLFFDLHQEFPHLVGLKNLEVQLL